jgi:hypothetical protein
VTAIGNYSKRKVFHDWQQSLQTSHRIRISISQFRIPCSHLRFAANSRVETANSNSESDSVVPTTGMDSNQALQHELELMRRVCT